MPIVRLYWRILKPKTHGVKVLILHPTNREMVLLVRHSYGNKKLWNLPGGGYNPKNESAIVAAQRELNEELDTKLHDPHYLCLYETNAEGKRDTVTVIQGEIDTDHFSLDEEIADYEWCTFAEAFVRDDVARVVRHSIRHL